MNWKRRFFLDRGPISEVNYGLVPVHDNPYLPRGNKGIHWETGLILAACVEAWAPKQVVELGTFRGYSTSWLMLGMNGKGKLDVFEVFPEGHQGTMLYDFYRFSKENFTYHEIPDGIWTHDPAIIPETIDLLYHDTDHLAGPTKKEMDLLLPRIPVGGHVLIDDVLHPYYPTMQAYLNNLFRVDLADSWRYEILPIGCGLGIAERKK